MKKVLSVVLALAMAASLATTAFAAAPAAGLKDNDVTISVGSSNKVTVPISKFYNDAGVLKAAEFDKIAPADLAEPTVVGTETMNGITVPTELEATSIITVSKLTASGVEVSVDKAAFVKYFAYADASDPTKQLWDLGKAVSYKMTLQSAAPADYQCDLTLQISKGSVTSSTSSGTGNSNGSLTATPGSSSISFGTTGEDNRLLPGNDYNYIINDVDGNNILQKGSTVSASWSKGGAMVDAVKIKEKSGVYYVVLELNENYTLIDLKDLTGTLTFKKTTLGTDSVTASINERVSNDYDTTWGGYSKIDDAEDDMQYALNNTVYEIDGSGWVSFGSDNRLAQITAKFSDGEKIFAYFNENSIDAVLDKYDDGEAQIDFIRFVAKPSLRKTSTITFDRGFSSKGYIYEWDGKTLKEIKGAKWDNEDGTWSIETSKLGDYVFSDSKLISTSNTESSSESESKDNSSSNTVDNPGTGANDFVGLAVALAVVSVAGIAVAKRK